MSDIGWVVLGFAVAYGSLAAYAASLRARLRRARAQLDDGK